MLRYGSSSLRETGLSSATGFYCSKSCRNLNHERRRGDDPGHRSAAGIARSDTARRSNGVQVAVEDAGIGLDGRDGDRIFNASLREKPTGWAWAVDQPLDRRSAWRPYFGQLRLRPMGALLQFTLPAEVGPAA